ncbi:glycosyltransferase [Bacteroides caccae]|mgnify:FL=1|jgi:putative colanic acid biosynthesis glycosyltransferase|uniref:Glycosyltransferase n=2 Tax=Bacteroides caccae TaxID=47678 RepID=A0A412FEL4_9BACE|nr:glycosyltransferase [Bacteroides caccae]RGN31897.1 glycosyltransferase [Bacteroides caccae]RGR66574.1 glycosyltransferase [Bacteroides caccae]
MFTIFQINVVANSGSTGRIVEGISEIAMKCRDAVCYTAYGRWANTSCTHLYRVGNKSSIYYHYVISRIFDKHGLASLRATKCLISKIKEVNPDLIHLHNIHGYYLNYPFLFQFLASANIPVVWTLHDCWAYTGHCVHYTDINCNKWITGCYDCPNLIDYPAAFFDHSRNNYMLKKRAFTSVNNLTIVTVSQWLANEVSRSFLSKYPIKVIHNGVDLDRFYPTKTNIKQKYNIGDKFIILGVATVWDKRKGLSDFLQLAKSLSSNEQIILVGLNKRQIARMPSNIIGLEKMENIHELVELYSGADLFVNFSVEETFGLTTAESMACGTPVLVYNSTACPEIVTEDTGFIIEPHDINKAIYIVNHLKSVGKLCYSYKCYTHIRQFYSKENKYKEYITLYEKLLQ